MRHFQSNRHFQPGKFPSGHIRPSGAATKYDKRAQMYGQELSRVLQGLLDIEGGPFELISSSQERNKKFYVKLLKRQWRLKSPICPVYRKGIEEGGEFLIRLLMTIPQNRIEQIDETVISLSLWADSVLQEKYRHRPWYQFRNSPEEHLFVDESLSFAILSLSGGIISFGGASQYLEFNLPLIVGILNYNSDKVGSIQRLGELDTIWKEKIKTWAS